MWLQAVGPSGAIDAPTVVRQRVSHDGGATWSPPDDAGTPGWHPYVRAAVDRRGRTHVVYEDWSSGPHAGRLAHLEWEGRWGSVEALFSALTAVDPDLRVRPDGSLVLAFVGRPAGAPVSADETFRAAGRLVR